MTISELPTLFSKRTEVDPRPSSWALMKKDIEQNTPFSRWDDKENVIQQMQWELTNLALKTIKATKSGTKQYAKIRHDLDRAIHSDQYWWASAMPWWSIEMIEAGAKEIPEEIIVEALERGQEELRKLAAFQKEIKGHRKTLRIVDYSRFIKILHPPAKCQRDKHNHDGLKFFLGNNVF